MKKTWILLGVLVPALLAVQHFGLERTAEKEEEDRVSRIADLKATRILPQYIASLFMGSFRAVAVDVLWVQLRRMREEEHRYFETVELMDMISTLQPRNPEVWVHQSWDAAYNIANHVRNPDEQWKWIKYGLEKLEEGTRQLSHDAYLKHEIGRVLVHKATWKEGVFQPEYMARLERDRDFQRRLLGREPDRAYNAFELAIPWYERALEDLERMKKEQRWRYFRTGAGTQEPDERDWWTTQVGLNIHPSSVDGNIYLAKYFNAWHHWRQARALEAAARAAEAAGKKDEAAKAAAESARRCADAAEWFRKSAGHARMIRAKYAASSPIYDEYAALSDALAEAALSRGDRLALLKELTEVLIRAGTKDYFYLARDLSEMKSEFGGDEFEFNDGLDHAFLVEFEKLVEANLAPDGDIDAFYGVVRPPEEERDDGHGHGGHEHRKPEFAPHRVGFQIKKDGDADVKATLWAFRDRRLQPLAKLELRESRWEEIEAVTDAAGHFIVVVEALKPGRDPKYLLRWALAEPVEPAK